MFEDTKQPEDMFEVTDKVAPQVTAPTDQPPSPPQAPAVVQERVAQVADARRGFPWKVIVLVVGILIVIGGAFMLSMKILGSRAPVTPEPPVVTQQEEVAEVEEEEMTEKEVTEEEEEVMKEPTVSRKDTDKDGLTDEEEIEFGTNIRSEDTDADGLFDLEEIRTWETDPLNSDTDGDGYLDGEEVDAGYNPSGEGALREAPTESS